MNAPWIKEEDVPAFAAWLDLFAEGQRALGYKAGLEAAWQAILAAETPYTQMTLAQKRAFHTALLILPVPEVQWRDLTDEEVDELSRTMVKGNKSVNWLSRAVIAKWKEANGIN